MTFRSFLEVTEYPPIMVKHNWRIVKVILNNIHTRGSAQIEDLATIMTESLIFLFIF